MPDYPPIALFAYNRPHHLRNVIDALRANVDADKFSLFIFSDAPRDEDARRNVEEVRMLIKNVSGFRSVEIIEQQANQGLAASIEAGVTKIVNEYGSIIVLEDDIVTSPFFLTFMKEALEAYKDKKQVMHVNGYVLPIGNDQNGKDAFFYRQTLSWGWATWKDRWQQYDGDAARLLRNLKDQALLKYYDIDGVFRFSSTLRANIRGDVRTWGAKWYACVVLAGGLAVSPRCSLAQNIGHDATGTNSGLTDEFDTKLCDQKLNPVASPITEEPAIQEQMRAFYRSIRPGFLEKIRLRLRWLRNANG